MFNRFTERYVIKTEVGMDITVAKGRTYNLKTGSKAYRSRMCRSRILVKLWESLYISTAMEGNPKRYRRWEEGYRAEPAYPIGLWFRCYFISRLRRLPWLQRGGCESVTKKLVRNNPKCNGYGIGRCWLSTDNTVFLSDGLWEGEGEAWGLERTKPGLYLVYGTYIPNLPKFNLIFQLPK